MAAPRYTSLRMIRQALGTALVLAVAKGLAALLTGSCTLLAGAVHSLADCANQLLLLVGLRRARRPPTPDSPLGYGKEIYFWSFLVALMLFSIGAMFALYAGVQRLFQPVVVEHGWLALAVLAAAVPVQGLALAGCLREVDRVRAGRSYWSWFRESRQSELLVVFGEHLAALLGLLLGLLGLGLYVLTGEPLYDALGALLLGVLLLAVAVFIAIEVKALLVGQSVDAGVRKAIIDYLGEREEIDQVYNLITLQLGDGMMVAIKARMRRTAGADFLIRDVNRVERGLREQFADIRFLFFEPDDEA